MERQKCEIWTRYKDLFYVSSYGNIKNNNGKILKNRDKNNFGYIRVKVNGKRYFIHRLIAECFIDNKNNYNIVNHKNGIKTDNRIENLEWCSASQNMIHAIKNNLLIPNTIGLREFNKKCGSWNKGLHTGNQYTKKYV